ncbi:LacI family DNA-binding transcriptional regulator [Mesobacillus zeae]|uniref:Catabolite control protein A n=1 Tax=Mesobacillus zeae TaxID=1917180 RepID=A0A398AVH7_9BACI|nr:LacI family DNA-binding transcriptional regulator [Mesobacillus zeae]RID81729.1 LacI family transcriptional regulator [Mesobacillus zeae]
MVTTIKEVAKKAGVSVATVSRVLNEKGYVNEDTRKNVLAAIEELNYRPNNVARSLFKKQSKTIGLIVPDINNPFFPQLARAVEDVTNEANFTVVLCNSDDKLEKEIGYFEMLQQNGADGVLFVSNTLKPEHINRFNFPIVALDRPLDSDIPFVTANNYEGAKLATNHLLDCGCKKIAHIRGPENVLNAEDRYRGFKDAALCRGVFDEELVISSSYQLDSAKKKAFQLLAKHPDIDGIFASNDVIAIGIIKTAEKLGYSIPENLMVAGFDGIQFGEIVSPELTTVAQPIYEMGSTAAEMLLKLIDGRLDVKKENVFNTELIPRQSTKL